jgi:hypothetical protein
MVFWGAREQESKRTKRQEKGILLGARFARGKEEAYHY